VGFTQARNTPFQGLAADGAKLGLWALVKAGYRVVAFIHDEFVIELPEGADHTREAKAIENILNHSMERVTGDIPVACEYALARRWSKAAKAEFDRAGRLIPCEITSP
jgi:DNA polymerase I-like protein with 3'-5' exonuclease and polymerase domains